MKESGMMKFVTSFMYILFGLALMLWPRQVENVICTILAVCVIVFGVLKLVSYSITKVESRIMNDTKVWKACRMSSTSKNSAMIPLKVC